MNFSKSSAFVLAGRAFISFLEKKKRSKEIQGRPNTSGWAAIPPHSDA
jgi:hypothetical protein